MTGSDWHSATCLDALLSSTGRRVTCCGGASRRRSDWRRIATLADRVRHVIQSAFDGRRIVIFSGGAAQGSDGVLDEVKGIAEGGSFGSIMGRNAFQRPKTEAIELLHAVMDLYQAQA